MTEKSSKWHGGERILYKMLEMEGVTAGHETVGESRRDAKEAEQ